ncbi:hypothetical protein HNR37_001522 [Desulfurispira natronophila]|uniref:Uncharacterized protein n=1 Tax=Desulfurispira natronophila TaxID=682562 RepID=A0A7W7Y5C3_9BACT|nr:hypothetical protein [Desulfurispira natronophila]
MLDLGGFSAQQARVVVNMYTDERALVSTAGCFWGDPFVEQGSKESMARLAPKRYCGAKWWL